MESPWSDLLSPLRENLGSPLVTHLVANGVRGDSRVLKAAQTSRAAGLESLIVGISLTGAAQAFRLEGVPVLLAPIGAGSADQPRTAPELPAFNEYWPGRMVAIEARRALRAAKNAPRRSAGHLRQVMERFALSRMPGEGAPPSWSTHRETTGSIVVAFDEVLSVLKPRMIHVHDLVPLPAAVAYAAGARVRRRQVWTIYDAHESALSLIESDPQSPYFRMMAEIETEFIHDVNEVLTVSATIAESLQREHGLPRTPGVVTNAPSAHRVADAPSVRAVAGLPPDVPLAVYSGWISPERGLDTVIRAMPSVPQMHLAVVCSSMTPGALAVYRRAVEVGVEDRLHMVGYVSPAEVTQYLSSATVGLIPHKAGVHLDLSLPTKYREYLHAGIPMVVSSNREMEAVTKATKVGRVFRCGNVAGLALQLNRVLADPDRYRRNITPALLAEHSWETQAKVLSATYRRPLAGIDRWMQDDAVLAGALRAIDPREEEASAAVSRPVRFEPEIASLRVGIGPSNSASQAFQWASAVNRWEPISAESFAASRWLNDEAHRVIPRLRSGHAANARELGTVLSRYTHLLVDGYTPLFGDLIADSLQGELGLLARHGIAVGLIAHGSEVRDPDRHMSRLDGSYFHAAPAEWTQELREITQRNQTLARSFAGPTFVATPDLLLDLPDATWLPLTIDIPAWSALAERCPDGHVPRVLHRPSRSVPPIKGTDVIAPVLEKLADEGLLELVPAADEVQHADMPELVAQADIVVDQIRTGSYGVAAIEAMAAGRVVVGHVAADVRALVPEQIPVVDAEPTRFEEAMRELLAQGETLRDRAAAGREFAQTWHDGRRSASVIRAFVDGARAVHES